MILHSRLVSRRRVVQGAALFGAAAMLPRPLRAMAGPGPMRLEARSGDIALLKAGAPRTPIWGYEGAAPGPVLRVKQGGEVWARLKNSLPQPTTVHWHGIRIANAMDGVAGLTQDPVAPGGTFDYRFAAPDAGTYWYHPHNRSWEQVARGLYGVLIVEEPSPPDVDQDIVLVADDWRLDAEGRIDEASLGSLFERAHAGRLGNVLTLNSRPLAEIPVIAGQRLRLRLCNTCNARVLDMRFEDLDPVLIALDGQPVPPETLAAGNVRLAPGQRADLLVDMTAAPGSRAAITEVSRTRLVAGHFVYHPSDRVTRRAEPVALAPNALPLPDLAGAQAVDLVMTGGAMGGLEGATYKGQAMEIRELARKHGQVWAFNGVAGMAEQPLFSAHRGRTVTVRMVNDTRWPHAMHIHGHHFRDTGARGQDAGPWRDTLLLEAGETRTVAFVADNPGKWMIHCHMLEHQAAGMATWFEVTL